MFLHIGTGMHKGFKPTKARISCDLRRLISNAGLQVSADIDLRVPWTSTEQISGTIAWGKAGIQLPWRPHFWRTDICEAIQCNTGLKYCSSYWIWRPRTKSIVYPEAFPISQPGFCDIILLPFTIYGAGSGKFSIPKIMKYERSVLFWTSTLMRLKLQQNTFWTLDNDRYTNFYTTITVDYDTIIHI